MKNPPAGWPRISNSVYYDDPRRAIDWLVKDYWIDRSCQVQDPEGHGWYFMQRLSRN